MVCGVKRPTILNATWPSDFDPATVPFTKRTVTVLRRQGFFDDWTLLDTATVSDVLSWWYAGPVTVNDLRTTGNDAICQYRRETELRVQLAADFDTVSLEPWAKHIWHHDPRFTEYLPKCESTVHDIAVRSTVTNRRYLWDRLESLYTAVESQAALGLSDAVAQYVEAISGQHGQRVEVLLARTGLNGQDPITRVEAGRMLGVSYQRIHQLERQLSKHRTRAGSPAGVWMPQATQAQRTGWPDGYTDLGIEAITRFVSPQRSSSQ
jgi:hypothetical protein